MAAVVSCGIATIASAQTTRTVRVVCYNIQDDVSNGFTTPTCGLIAPFTGSGGSFTTNCTGSVTNGGVLEGIGEEIIAGDPAQPIDVLALEETSGNSVTVQPIVSGLNAFYAYYTNPARYAMSSLQLTDTGGEGGGPNALVYNTNTLQLLASVGVGTPSGSGEARQVGRYLFAPAGVATNALNLFYVYVSHYKAESDTNSENRRYIEAMTIRNDEASNLPANSRVLYVGDYNPDDNSGEPGYQTICSNSAPNGIKQGQGVDPLNILWGPYTDAATNIDWSDSTTNHAILFMLSEEGYELRYRDDLQIMTSNVYYDVAGGLQYIQGSYHSFGNNGSFVYGSSVNTSGNTALNDLDPVLTNLYKLSAAVLLEDLTGASDHLPIVADYTIPLPVTAPVASFTAGPTNGVAPLIVAFTDTSTGTPTIWAWTFGDSGTSTSQNPSHTYTAPGTYTVRLIASNAGGSSTNTQVNLITALTPPPVASFTASPTNGVAPLTVNFTDTSSNSPTSWAWAFGDTGTSTAQDPSHTYTTPGTYTVTLIASNAGGSSTNTRVNLITALTPPPIAGFTATPTTGMEPLLVTFTDTSSGSITDRFWMFGDGNTLDTGTNSVTDTYTAGVYTVTLIVSGPGGASTNTQVNYINVLTAFQNWQVQYFGSTTNAAADPNADPDGDGCNNLCEFLSGTDPTNSASSFGIISVTTQGSNGADVVITWTEGGGRTNVVQATAGTVDGSGSYATNFTDLSSFIIIQGTGVQTTNYLDASGATNSPARYYRIRLQP